MHDESDPAEDDLGDRLALQHAVVGAVLSLKEPYRTVVLMHYYEGLSAAAIAARKHVPSGTVRSQLSRAHELLRSRLDSLHDGNRGTWAHLILPFVERPPVLAVAQKLIAAAVVVAGVVLVPVGLWWIDGDGIDSDKADERFARDLPPPASEALRSGTQTSQGAAASPTAAFMGSASQIEATPVADLVAIAEQAQRLLAEKLLTPDDFSKQQYSALIGLPDAGVARILDRQLLTPESTNMVGIRGGGAYFSFATRSNSYDDQPDIELNGKRFTSGFYGGVTGWVMDLGTLALMELPKSPTVVPAGLDEAQQAAYALMWSDLRAPGREGVRRFQEGMRKLKVKPDAEARLGSTYLVRCSSEDEHDVLAAFCPTAADEFGYTIAWRILQAWPVQQSRHAGDSSTEGESPTVVAPWLTKLGIQDLFDLLAQIRANAQTRLLQIPEQLAANYRDLLQRSDTGLTRLLPRSKYDAVMSKQGAGAFYSFATRDHDYQHEPDILLEEGQYRSGFAGNDRGLLLDVGNVALEGFNASPWPIPGGIDEARWKAWEFLWTTCLIEDRGRRALGREGVQQARDVGLLSQAEAHVGHTYVMRSILPGRHDILVAFQPVSEDEHGHFIAWRILHAWDELPEHGTRGVDGEPGRSAR